LSAVPPPSCSTPFPYTTLFRSLIILQGTLLALCLLSLLGWRWTYAWRREARLATLAAVWIPLPYLLGHAGALWGPRLPLDGVLRSEEHTSELQSLAYLVCRLLL